MIITLHFHRQTNPVMLTGNKMDVPKTHDTGDFDVAQQDTAAKAMLQKVMDQ